MIEVQATTKVMQGIYVTEQNLASIENGTVYLHKRLSYSYVEHIYNFLYVTNILLLST